MTPCPQCSGSMGFPRSAEQWRNVGSLVRLSAEQLEAMTRTLEGAKIVPLACGSCAFAYLGLELTGATAEEDARQESASPDD